MPSCLHYSLWTTAFGRADRRLRPHDRSPKPTPMNINCLKASIGLLGQSLHKSDFSRQEISRSTSRISCRAFTLPTRTQTKALLVFAIASESLSVRLLRGDGVLQNERKWTQSIHMAVHFLASRMFSSARRRIRFSPNSPDSGRFFTRRNRKKPPALVCLKLKQKHQLPFSSVGFENVALRCRSIETGGKH